VRRCLLHGITCGDALTGLPSATQTERRRRRQTIGQDREGLVARMTDSASHPNVFIPVIVDLAEPSSVADDRMALAKRTSPKQEVQWDHPGSMLSFVSGSAIKENHCWRGGPPLTVAAKVPIRWLGLHPSDKISFERNKNTALLLSAATPHLSHWPVIFGHPSSTFWRLLGSTPNPESEKVV
jgi:hypothetical protein